MQTAAMSRATDYRRLQVEARAIEVLRLIRRLPSPGECNMALEKVREAALAYYRSIGQAESKQAREWSSRGLKEILVWCVRQSDRSLPDSRRGSPE
jgi:hypothetical protein